MSSKSCRRRQRKAKQNNQIQAKQYKTNYEDKFKIIEQNKSNDLLLSGYVRQIKQDINDHIPMEIEKICMDYFNDETIMLKELDEVIPAITDIVLEKEPYLPSIRSPSYHTEKSKYDAYQKRKKHNKLKVIHCVIKMNSTFNKLNSHQKRLIIRRIIRQKKLPVHELRIWPIDTQHDKRNINIIYDQLYFTEYILCKRYSTASKLDLSELELNDQHILYLCNAVENGIKYNIQKKQKQLQEEQNDFVFMQKSSKQRPSNSQNGAHNVNKQNVSSKGMKFETPTPKYSQNRRVQQEVERQLEKMKQQKQKNDKNVKVAIKMKLDEINLSMNNISDKHLALLLRTIKKYMPSMKSLNLSSNNITNKSLSIIMKYSIKGLKIDLSNNKKITLKALNKYARTDYDDETPEKYVYCQHLVYFVNQKEEQYTDNIKPKGGKYVRGKGKKFRGNRKRMLFTGQDGQETGYLSTEFDGDWWNYQ